ncbi:MAG: hypothetical protein KAI22_11340 [Gammaproteobacteria bacterium]|nr:hypothetical protein [Gammaproteobacteria bacterium]
MQQVTGDRRNLNKAFPLTDCDKHQVDCERRCGKERRKHRRNSDVARNIINIIN